MADIKSKSLMKKTAIVVVPLMVLILTVVVVGMSYAWFGINTTVYIETIDFSTAPVYTLEFTLTDAAVEPYNGQTGVLASRPDSNGVFNAEAALSYGKHLVSSNWANNGEHSALFTESVETKYLMDAPFEFYADMALITGADPIDMRISITNLLIEFRTTDGEGNVIPDPSYASQTLKLPNNEGGSVDDIACGFTWYMVQSSGSGANRVYSPYGVSSVSGEETVFTNYRNGVNGTWSGLPELHDITNFSASGETFRLYIVFAPEKLFWYQYSTYSDAAVNNGKQAWQWNMADINGETGVYDSTELNKYGWSYLNYTSQTYAGATFEFTVTVERTGS